MYKFDVSCTQFSRREETRKVAFLCVIRAPPHLSARLTQSVRWFAGIQNIPRTARSHPHLVHLRTRATRIRAQNTRINVRVTRVRWLSRANLYIATTVPRNVSVPKNHPDLQHGISPIQRMYIYISISIRLVTDFFHRSISHSGFIARIVEISNNTFRLIRPIEPGRVTVPDACYKTIRKTGFCRSSEQPRVRSPCACVCVRAQSLRLLWRFVNRRFSQSA